ncbi:nucleotide exchange factor GrpE [Longimicrobium sp.]|uniref:nucleotide exchange factor GrpE n=1 Tax=Longimicrobium sp. TaxID=2029185 RepID=UPI002C716AD5|nr:nucleotide exchange factor GrpE [Longimicrobium sp.]HSU17964.1 nucleotide exchange factor GrpE [Longimicrobium sp.]
MADHKHHHRHHHGARADEQGARPNGKANGHAEPAPAEAEPQAADAGAQAPPQPVETPAADPASELQAVRERHLRLAAEFENYRKRVERERSEAWVRAQAQLAERLLEPLDDLQRIADFDPATTPAAALHEGAEMVEKKFLRALEAAGLEEIDAAGKPFDPTQHEALTTMPAESEADDDTVGQVFRKGYRFKGVLVRPAQVVVRKHG